MEKLLFNCLFIDIKKWLSLFFILIIVGIAINHTAWARGGHSGGGSVIGGGGGGFSGGGRSLGHFGGGHRHYGHSHRHNYHLGIGFGGFYGAGFFGPGYYGPGFYGYPYSYGYRYPGNYYYPRRYYSPLVAPSAQTVYIQRETPAATSAQPATTNYWYFCRNPEGYYPYVKTCSEGWLQVAPQPTPQ